MFWPISPPTRARSFAKMKITTAAYAKTSRLTNTFAAVMLWSLSIHSVPAAPWVNTGALNLGRHSHTATLLPNGKVLVTGGVGRTTGITDSVELYDPATGSNQPTGSLAISRRDHTATLLLNGKVLVAGGLNGALSLDIAELYDPATGTWSAWALRISRNPKSRPPTRHSIWAAASPLPAQPA
jgi:Kelch motif